METKKTKTGGIIGTAAAVLLCGCPGLCLCLFGALTAANMSTYTTEIGNTLGTGVMPQWTGFAMLCGAIIMIAIPVVVGFLTLRDKKPKVENFNETLPPTA
jgi:formate hydrogenlyase subunit 3/multisubunit Na+/H+ antiporter MnhD subunit